MHPVSLPNPCHSGGSRVCCGCFIARHFVTDSGSWLLLITRVVSQARTMIRASVLPSHLNCLTLDECIAQIWQSKQITPEQCSLLRSWLLQTDVEVVPSRDRQVVDRLLHAVRRGWIVLR